MQRIELVLVLRLLGKQPLDQPEQPGEPGFESDMPAILRLISRNT